MGDSYMIGNKVYFSNGYQCGKVVYDKDWNCNRFISKPGVPFSAGWLKDIAQLIK